MVSAPRFAVLRAQRACLRLSPLVAIADPDHEEHEQMLEWVGGEFDAESVDPATVRFDDPKRRWRKAFGRGR